MNVLTEKLSPWLFTLGLFVLWELACRIFNIDKFILPTPSETFVAMAQFWRPLLRHSLVTLWTTMAGFAIAVAFGVVLGLIVGWSRTIYRGLYPVMIGFNCIPKVAVVLRKGVGFGVMAMTAGDPEAITFVWPGAQICFTGVDACVQVVHRREVERAADPTEVVQRLAARYEGTAAPWIGAHLGYIDDVIHPQETRARIARALGSSKLRTRARCSWMRSAR